jgi:3-dehydrosphinganine reductase
MSDLHAIITGGSSGIGKALAFQLAEQGYCLSLIARDVVKLNQVECELKARFFNLKVQIISADVGDSESIMPAVERAIDQFGAPELLVTSAGIAEPGYFEALSIDNFERAMRINYLGSVYAVKAAIPAMISAKTGRVVLISSGAAFTGIFGYTSYGASKFALRGFAEALRAEMKPKGVGVSIVYPPDTDTPQLIAENLTKPAETKSISGGAKALTAESVALTIIRGIKKKKFSIAPGFEMKMLNSLNSCLAPVLYRYFDRVIRKTQSRELL